MNGQRVGHRQLEVLRGQLSQRDLDLLEAIGTYRLLRGDQARRLHFADHATTDTAARVARRVLRRLNGLGLVARLHRRVGGVRAGSAGHIYTLTPLGHRLLGSPKRKRTSEPSYAFVHHTLAIAELATRLIEAERGNRFELLQLQPEPAAWRHYVGDLVASTLKPDLFIRLADDDFELSWFIEIDCGTESAPTIQRKCLVYGHYQRTGIEQAEHGVFPLTAWVAPDQQRVEQIRRAIGSDSRIDPRLFVATTFEHAIDVLTGNNRQSDSP